MVEKEKKTPLAKKILSKKWLIIVLVIALGLFFWRSKTKDTDLLTSEIKRGTVTEELILAGEVRAEEHAQLSFPTSGEISWMGVSEGDKVVRGQILARLDPRAVEAAYESARLDLWMAEATLDRVYDEIKDHDDDETFAMREKRTAAEAAKNKAIQALVVAERNLANLVIRAPFAGIISRVTHSYGRITAHPSEGQIEIVNPETFYFSVNADQTEVIDILEGQKVKIVLDSFLDEEFEGEVVFVGLTPRVGEIGINYGVKVKFLDEVDTKKVRAGMTGDARFSLFEKEGVLYIPPRFLKSDIQGRFVSLGSKNNKVYVEVGTESEERIEISGEIKKGDIVYD